MGNYVYSALTNYFYPISLMHLYENAGTWPEDAIVISDEDFECFTGTPPLGMQRGGRGWLACVATYPDTYL